MKKSNFHIKRITLVLICFIFFINCAGCRKSGSNPNTTNKENIPEKETVNLRIYSNKSEQALDFSEYYNSFNEMLAEEFNIELEAAFQFLNYGFDEEFISDKDLFVLDGAYLQELLGNLKTNNNILPITYYVEQSSVWSELPDYYKNAYKDESGEVWGIPFSDKPLLFGRAVNLEWLKATKYDLPETVSELYELLYAFTYNDPDQNGQNDTYGVGMSDNHIGFLSFKDILEANGCRLSYSFGYNESGVSLYNTCLAGYNPKSGKFEDALQNPGFMEALIAIEGIIRDGLLLAENDTFERGVFSNNAIGTNMAVIENCTIYPDKADYIFGLTGSSTESMSTILLGGNGAYFASRNIKNPEVVIPRFINTFLGSIDGYKLARYGLLGEKYRYVNKKGVITAINQDKSIISNIQLLGDLSWHEADLHIVNNDVNYVKMISEGNYTLLSQWNMSLLNNTTRMQDFSADIRDIYAGNLESLFFKFCTGDIASDELCDELIKLHKLYSVDQWIDDENVKLNNH